MNISDEAVVAAAKVLYADKISNHAGDNAPQIIDVCEKVARTILEAAAPHLMAPVLALADEMEASTLSGDNYSSGRGSGFRMAGVRIRQALGLA